jgi:hypothetical protein
VDDNDCITLSKGGKYKQCWADIIEVIEVKPAANIIEVELVANIDKNEEKYPQSLPFYY